MSFVGLHIHSDYSLLDGASQLLPLIERAKELGMPAIAVTDHGVMYGAIELIKICRDRGIKPIIGNEMYVINGNIEIKHKKLRKYHQLVLAKNTQGYKNLVKLTTISHLKGKQGRGIFERPCINKELLEKYGQGLIITSGCLGSEIPQLILGDRLDEAYEVAKWYQNLLGEDYYLEIQDHGSKDDRIVNVQLAKISKDLGIKLVATNDSHFISCNDVEAHDALLCINTNKLITDNKRMRYSGTEYLKSAEEMKQLFRDHLPDEVIEDAISNTLEVAEKVQPYDIMGKPRIPNYRHIPSGDTVDSYLEQVTWKGLRERLFNDPESKATINQVYKERLQLELKTIQEKQFSSYFLVVWEYIKYARENQIPVGPGRGSAAGSLVAYSLKITNIDPVSHGLLFERFLNPERKSMPDIDSDFCIERRDDMIKHVTEEYGAENVAQIITFNRMTSKAILKDVGRVLGVPYGDADRLAKLIPVSRGKPAKLKVMISDETPEPKFKEAYEKEVVNLKNERGEQTDETISVRQWIDMAMRLEGTNKTFGVHAAGVVISAEPLDEIVPLQKNNDGAVITQYSMEDLESLGLLKMDFLGLKNLTIIQNTTELIKQTCQLDIKPDNLPRDERKNMEIVAKGNIRKLRDDIKKTYELLGKGDLEGIFQLESSGMRQVVQKLKPSNIEDVSSILALYRPGPLDAGLIDKFIDRKHGREPIEYEHPLLRPILQETYAVLVYQEQIMKVAQDLAGYSLGEADLLRRAMGKKKPEEMQKHRGVFIDGAAKNGIPKKLAENLFEQMLKFAEYCFNKSHSTAYAYVTYQTAYLKANYPVEYMSVLLSANSDDQDKVQRYITNCKNMGIGVEGPDINRSDVKFTPQKTENKILFGLSAVKNVGTSAIEEIVKVRREVGSFKDLVDLCDRVDLHIVNKRALEALIKCGALDKINSNRKQLLDYLAAVIDWVQKSKQKTQSGIGIQGTLFAMEDYRNKPPELPEKEDFPPPEKLQFEKELLGFFISHHPLEGWEEVAKNQGLEIVSLNQLAEQKGRKPLTVLVMLTEVKQHLTKEKGDRMAFLQIEDLTGKAEAIAFPKTYEKFESSLIIDTPVLLKGKLDRQDEQKIQLIVDEVEIMKSDEHNSLEKRIPSEESMPLEPSNKSPEFIKEDVTVQGSLIFPKTNELSRKISACDREDRAIAKRDICPIAPSINRLKLVQRSAEKLGLHPINIRQFPQQEGDRKIVVVAGVKQVKQQQDSASNLLTYLQIEDLEIQGTAVVFPQTYERIAALLKPEKSLVFWGKVDRRKQDYLLIVEDAVDLELEHIIFLILTPEEATSDLFKHRLNPRLQELSGQKDRAKVPVIAVIQGREFDTYQAIRLSQEFWVQDSTFAVNNLKSLGFHAQLQTW